MFKVSNAANWKECRKIIIKIWKKKKKDYKKYKDLEKKLTSDPTTCTECVRTKSFFGLICFTFVIQYLPALLSSYMLQMNVFILLVEDIKDNIKLINTSHVFETNILEKCLWNNWF